MKCENCGCDTEKALLTSEGCVCALCAEAAGKRQAELFEQLAKESLDCAPAEMDITAFHRWTLKLAIQTLRALSRVQKTKMAKRNPVMSFPEDLAVYLNGLILDCMPQDQFQCKRQAERVYTGRLAVA